MNRVLGHLVLFLKVTEGRFFRNEGEPPYIYAHKLTCDLSPRQPRTHLPFRKETTHSRIKLIN